MSDTTARVLVRKMLADAANDVASHESWSSVETEGLIIKRQRVKMLQEISDAFDSPAPATVGALTYGEMIINIFRANDVREGSTFTHGACIGMMEAAIEATELTFNADLDKWVKIIGAGVTGYQPEAYAAIDAAMNELVRKRAQISAIGELLP